MAYLGKTPSQAVRSRYYFTATGGETALSGADDNANTLTFTDGNYVDVALNGVTLVAGTDYNTTTANTIGGLTALVASDVVEVIVYDTFSVFGGNMAANLNFKDNVKANFGTGNDLVIYHDGSNSIINDAGTGSLKFQYGGTDGVVFDNSGNVGIGTASPVSNLHIYSTSYPALRFDDGTAYSSIYNDSTDGSLVYSADDGNARAGSKQLFYVDGTERLRIDSSGQLIVGHTGAGSPYFNEGIVLNPAGDSVFHRNGNSVVDFSRQTSDGNIVRFVKDNSVVGSIGVASGNAYIDGGAGISGIQFGVGDIRPRYNGALVDGSAADIGHPSNRWQNLYLSGGVYLGGTGSANKLDDYEEGTWTPAFCDAGSGGNEFGYTGAVEGRYTKVGSMVTVWFYGRTDGSTTGITTSNQLFIQGLPFTINMSSNGTFAFVRSSTQGTLQATTGPIIARLSNGVTYLTMEKQFGDTSAPYSTSALLISEWEGGYGANITGFVSYKTDS